MGRCTSRKPSFLSASSMTVRRVMPSRVCHALLGLSVVYSGRDTKGYPSKVSDDEWAFVAPYLTMMKEDALQREHSLREVFNGVRYIVCTGIQWRMMPNDLPPWYTVCQQTQCWLKAGVPATMGTSVARTGRCTWPSIPWVSCWRSWSLLPTSKAGASRRAGQTDPVGDGRLGRGRLMANRTAWCLSGIVN